MLFCRTSANGWITTGRWNRLPCGDPACLHVPIDLLGLAVPAQQTAQDSHAAHPAQLLRHAGIRSTLPLT